jgi:hypothetical protein
MANYVVFCGGGSGRKCVGSMWYSSAKNQNFRRGGGGGGDVVMGVRLHGWW